MADIHCVRLQFVLWYGLSEDGIELSVLFVACKYCLKSGAFWRLYAEDEASKTVAQQVLVYVLDQVLRMLHPFMPFITEEIWQAIPHEGESLMIAE